MKQFQKKTEEDKEICGYIKRIVQHGASEYKLHWDVYNEKKKSTTPKKRKPAESSGRRKAPKRDEPMGVDEILNAQLSYERSVLETMVEKASLDYLTQKKESKNWWTSLVQEEEKEI